MKRSTTRTRLALLAVAVGALLVPSALARPTAPAKSPSKPTLQATKPGTKVTYALYLAALAGTATTSR
jgi:hypothetical protein